MQTGTSGYDLFISRTIHEEFSQKPGSHRIASAFSLCHLSRLMRLRRPKVVLEIGAGIGTISQLILLHHERVQSLYSIEQDAFCCAALRENLTPQAGQKWNLVHSHTVVPNGLVFDLMVFDGNQYDHSTFGLLSAETAVFIDGMRRETRGELASHCERVGLSLLLHEYTGAWHVGLRGLSDKRSTPGLVFKRNRCHSGVCKAKAVLPR